MVLAAKNKRIPSNKHKKRYGQHRKQTKPYLKPYWPYLPIIGIIILGFAANSFWTNSSHAVLGYSTNISQYNLLKDTNSQRNSFGEQPLNLNGELAAAAQTKANDMAKENYWSHYTPTGEAPWVFIKNAGYNYESAGENLAYGFSDSQSTLTAWMNSPEHRVNILDKNYKDVGFGIANATNYMGTGPETIVVAMYGQPAGSDPSTSIQSNKISPAFTVVGTSQSAPIQSISSKPVSRIQTILGTNSSWIMTLSAFLAGACLVLLLVRHALAWHKLLRKSEDFIVKHPWLDVFMVAIIVGSVVLTQGAGTIL